MYVAISGIIGAGKTHLATKLAAKLNVPVFYEPVDNNKYLADFYEDMPKYGFAMQVYLLNQRFRQQQRICWGEKRGVQDRTIYEDAIFAKMLLDIGMMEHRDHQTYTELAATMLSTLGRPDVVVHLDVAPEEALERINQRGRACEKSISLDYLTNLETEYQPFLQNLLTLGITVVRVDWNDFRDVNEVVDAIAAQVPLNT